MFTHALIIFKIDETIAILGSRNVIGFPSEEDAKAAGKRLFPEDTTFKDGQCFSIDGDPVYEIMPIQTLEEAQTIQNGTVEEDGYGNVHFKFEDGAFAVVYWEPYGELGDGQGGEFGDVEHDTLYSEEQLISLAEANCGRGKRSIIRPKG